MTITVWPVDAVSGAPSYTGRHLRQGMAYLVAGATSSRPLGGHTGIRPGSGTVVTATSTQWTVTQHAGCMDLEAAAEAGAYGYAVDQPVSGTLTAADGTYPRTDIVYLTLNDPAESDGSTTPSVSVNYLAGSAAASPAPPPIPTAVASRSFTLAQINVPQNGTGSPSVTMVAPYSVAAGAPIPVLSQSERDGLGSWNGLTVWRRDVGVYETWDGTRWLSGWRSFTPAVYHQPSGSQVAIDPSLYTVGTCVYSRSTQGTVTAIADVILSATTAGGARVGLPVSAPQRFYALGTGVMTGTNAPTNQIGVAWTSSYLNSVGFVNAQGAYLDSTTSAALGLRYNVTYPAMVLA